jgi:hypothetical protein
LRVCRLNYDDVRTFFHHLDLLARFQIARRIRLRAHPLDGRHHIGLLVRGNIAKRRGPAKILRQLFQHAGKLQKRHHRRIPILILRGLHQCVTGQVVI